MTAGWRALKAELDHWASEGRIAGFWWRDDDAVAVTPALDRLLALQQDCGSPLALAIIPARIEPGLAERLADLPKIAALQHGYAHHNHASLPEKKSEFPASRPLADRLADMRAGQALMERHFGSRHLSVFVPPWNRIAPDCLPAMTSLGYRAISAFQARSSYWAAPDLAVLNAHIDPIDWHGADNAAAAGRSLLAACAHLRAMRLMQQPLQPIGLLTHHLRHDEVVWGFVTDFLVRTAGHAAVRWLAPEVALEIGAPGFPSPPVTPTS